MGPTAMVVFLPLVVHLLYMACNEVRAKSHARPSRGAKPPSSWPVHNAWMPTSWVGIVLARARTPAL